MELSLERVFGDAVSLSAAERSELVYRLIDTLPDDELEAEAIDISEEELDRRLADREGSIPWSELRDE